MDPDPVCPERLDPDPVNIRPDPQPWTHSSSIQNQTFSHLEFRDRWVEALIASFNYTQITNTGYRYWLLLYIPSDWVSEQATNGVAAHHIKCPINQTQSRWVFTTAPTLLIKRSPQSRSYSRLDKLMGNKESKSFPVISLHNCKIK